MKGNITSVVVWLPFKWV